MAVQTTFLSHDHVCSDFPLCVSLKLRLRKRATVETERKRSKPYTKVQISLVQLDPGRILSLVMDALYKLCPRSQSPTFNHFTAPIFLLSPIPTTTTPSFL